MKAYFGTPTYDKQVSVDYHNAMLQTVLDLQHRGIGIQTHIVAGNCFIDRARNEIVHAFLASDATDLFFIDADIGWDHALVPRYLNYQADIVAGLVPKRDSGSESVYHQNALTGEIQEGLFRSLEAPTAFMRIKRCVFERMDEAYPQLKTRDRESKFIPYFETGVTDGGFQGEDINFCRKWCAIGSLWIDADGSFSHRGSKVWKGNFYDHAVATGLLKL